MPYYPSPPFTPRPRSPDVIMPPHATHIITDQVYSTTIASAMTLACTWLVAGREVETWGGIPVRKDLLLIAAEHRAAARTALLR
jgi:hypothetical protein